MWRREPGSPVGIFQVRDEGEDLGVAVGLGNTVLILGILKVEVTGLADGVGMSRGDESGITALASLAWMGDRS